MNLTEEQILHLAPDDSSRKAGKDLANPGKWVTRGCNDRAAWGECQGSGSKPYQTVADLANLAFKCSCPSRKFPCKHGIGLLVLAARQPALFTDQQEPDWARDWLDKRLAREEQKTEKKEDKPVDEAAQAKRQQARQKKVADGMEELLLWLKDIVRSGLLHMPSKPAAFWENSSKRMIDAQAPGLAGMIRTLGNTNFFREGWQTEFLDQIVRIYLVIEGYKNRDTLHQDLQSELLSLIGFTVSQEELKEQNGILDDWLVLGKQSSEDQGITTEKFWLFGTRTKRYALILQFLVRGQGAQLSLAPGMLTKAELVFFPSSNPLRALVKRQLNTEGPGSCQGFGDWAALDADATVRLGQSPFDLERPCIVEKLIPVKDGDRWWLQDQQRRVMPLSEDFKKIWTLVAMSGGEPLNMALVGKARQFEPIGVWKDHQYKII